MPPRPRESSRHQGLCDTLADALPVLQPTFGPAGVLECLQAGADRCGWRLEHGRGFDRQYPCQPDVAAPNRHPERRRLRTLPPHLDRPLRSRGHHRLPAGDGGRPALTHDLLRNVLQALGAEVLRINITELRDDVFYARIVLRFNGRRSRSIPGPSDALTWPSAPTSRIFVDESVMQEAATQPGDRGRGRRGRGGRQDDERLDVFKDFVESLDLDDIEFGGPGT